MTQEEVEMLLPVITPFPVPALIDDLYAIALARFGVDAPACLGTSFENTAVTYYIASMLSSGAGMTGVKSEKIDDYTITYGEGGQTQEYILKYHQIVENCNRHLSLSAISTGVQRDDSLDCLDLDAAGVCGVENGGGCYR